MALYATTDMMTAIIGCSAAFRKSLLSECGVSVAEYRLLAFLSDQGKPIQPSDATQTLDVSPTMTTLTTNSLVNKGLATRPGAKGASAIEATQRGKALCQEADTVLEHVHHSLFSPLPIGHKDTVVVGTQMTVMAMTKSNRMKGNAYFGEYETFHAFLIIEKLMTETAQSFGLSMNGFRILFYLDEKGGQATPGALAEALALAPSAVTYAAKALERDGFAFRRSAKFDKRSVIVQITESGSEVLRESLQRMDALLMSGFREAPASERKTIQEACKFVAAAVRKSAS